MFLSVLSYLDYLIFPILKSVAARRTVRSKVVKLGTLVENLAMM